MSEIAAQKTEQKKNWTLTAASFQKLLNWLDKGANSDGQHYLEMRQRLVSYFDRKNCLTPDDLADETLNRVARRLEETEIIGETPAKYCYVVARFVFMEYLRGKQREEVPLDEAIQQTPENRFAASDLKDENEMREKSMKCLDQCMEKLEPQNREIIIRYYIGKERVKIENRRGLADSLGITMNALSIRACRIRDKLEACVGKCESEG